MRKNQGILWKGNQMTPQKGNLRTQVRLGPKNRTDYPDNDQASLMDNLLKNLILMTPAKGSPANPNGSPRMPGCMSLILELGDEARVKKPKKGST